MSPSVTLYLMSCGRVSLLNPQLTNISNVGCHLASERPCLYLLCTGIAVRHQAHLEFVWVLGNLGSGPYTCVASTLPGELSPGSPCAF